LGSPGVPHRQAHTRLAEVLQDRSGRRPRSGWLALPCRWPRGNARSPKPAPVFESLLAGLKARKVLKPQDFRLQGAAQPLVFAISLRVSSCREADLDSLSLKPCAEFGVEGPAVISLHTHPPREPLDR
jgi:hypothetical protein